MRGSVASKHRRPFVIIGLMSGCGVAVGIMALGWLNQGRSALLTLVVNFLVSLPVLLVWPLTPPTPLIGVVCFVYWVAVGAFFGWLMSRSSGLRLAVTLVAVCAFVLAHRMAQVTLEAELGEILPALVAALTGHTP